MRLAPPTILDEHVPFLDVLDVKVFIYPLYVDSLICLNPCQCLFKILSICFKLVLRDSIVDIRKLICWVMRCCHLTLSYEEFFGLLHFDVDRGVVVYRVKHDKRVR